MYMYAEGTVKFGDGAESVFGENDGYQSVDDVKQYALSLIREDEERTFSIAGTLVTDYSNRDFKIEYDGEVCTISETDYYWWHGYDDGVWGDGAPEEQLDCFCGNYEIMPDTPAYESLKKAYESHGRYIFSNDDHTEFYGKVPYQKPVTIYQKGETLESDSREEAKSSFADLFDFFMPGAICDVCGEEFAEEEMFFKRSPDGEVYTICEQCCKERGMSDWEDAE